MNIISVVSVTVSISIPPTHMWRNLWTDRRLPVGEQCSLPEHPPEICLVRASTSQSIHTRNRPCRIRWDPWHACSVLGLYYPVFHCISLYSTALEASEQHFRGCQPPPLLICCNAPTDDDPGGGHRHIIPHQTAIPQKPTTFCASLRLLTDLTNLYKRWNNPWKSEQDKSLVGTTHGKPFNHLGCATTDPRKCRRITRQNLYNPASNWASICQSSSSSFIMTETRAWWSSLLNWRWFRQIVHEGPCNDFFKANSEQQCK